MKYSFPIITHIDLVREAIKARGGDEFIEKTDSDYHVFNYRMSSTDTFPPVDDEHAAILRECRGITFYPDGRIASRKFHKFFNLNERSETVFSEIDWSQPHVILEKLDGSMITPFLRSDGEVEMHTKMGKTDVADFVVPFIKKNEHYVDMCSHLITQGVTPIFEFCSRMNRIVIDHPVDRLVLLAVRDNVSGQYWRYPDLQVLGEDWGIDVVRQFEGTVENMETFIDEAKNEKDMEGYVIRFNDGHMLKIKADVYVTLHKAVAKIQQEKDVWNLILEDKIDDLIPLLPEERRDALIEFQKNLIHEVTRLSKIFETEFNSAVSELDSYNFSLLENPEKERKRMFAIDFVNSNEALPDGMRNLMFALYDGASAYDTVRDFFIRNTSTGTKVNKVRHLVGGLVWKQTDE